MIIIILLSKCLIYNGKVNLSMVWRNLFIVWWLKRLILRNHSRTEITHMILHLCEFFHSRTLFKREALIIKCFTQDHILKLSEYKKAYRPNAHL